jgi:hypothetical protein
MTAMSDRPLESGSPGDDWLERALVTDAREHAHAYVADAGFTARVMDALPSPLALPAWRRWIVFALWGVAAFAFVLALPAAATEVARGIFRLLASHSFSLSEIAAALSLAVVAMWTATAVALRRE